MFVEVLSILNMLCHIQKVDLCQSDIMKLETSQLSYYRNAAKMSQKSLYYNNEQVKLYKDQQFN